MPQRVALYLSSVLLALLLAEWLVPFDWDEAADTGLMSSPRSRSLQGPAPTPDLPTTHLVHAPLFDPSRSAPDDTAPAPSPEVDAAPPEGDLPISARLTLVGVVGTGSTRFAIIRDQIGAQLYYPVVGSTVAGWRVDRILSDRVVLGAGGQSVEVPFQFGKSPHQ